MCYLRLSDPTDSKPDELGSMAFSCLKRAPRALSPLVVPLLALASLKEHNIFE